MPLIPKVGLTRGKNIGLLAVFYSLLLLGSVTMVVPFLMTLTTSVSNQYDLPQYNVIPRFLYDDDALFIKFLFRKYQTFPAIKDLYRISRVDTLTDFSAAERPLQTVLPPLEYDRWDTNRLAVAWQDWLDFWEQARSDPSVVRTVVPLYTPETTIAFQQFLRAKYVDRWRAAQPSEARVWPEEAQDRAALALLNQTYEVTAGTSFDAILLRGGASEYGRLALPDQSQRTADYLMFLATLPADRVMLGSPDGGYQSFLKEQFGTIEKLNATWGTNLTYWSDIRFLPAGTNASWRQYVTTRMPLADVTLSDPPSDAEYRAWLTQRHGDLAGINAALKTKFATLEEIAFPATLPLARRLRPSWLAFAVERVPVNHWQIASPARYYHAFLQHRYGSIAKLAATYGQAYGSFAEVRPPQTAFDRLEFLHRQRELTTFFLTDNFRQVFRYIAVQGRALWNTLMLVGATLLAALTINPMAAYALSRFKIKNKQAILIAFLLPMSFPGEVTQIPSFILVRDLGLLNTYGALILPGLANGFSIFMLKGFFDGLPQELYEAAALDGANEWTVYWNITFPLCKPILALTVLGTVVGAYSSYMWALIICPAQEKWTLAVWVFQFSVDAMERGQGHLQMAALVLLSIPTMLIFLFTQRIIMKGIVLPTMK